MNPRTYQKELDRVLEGLEREAAVPRLLLHSCCAPCSSYVLEYLSRYFEITVLYYNPNIYPPEEFGKRLKEQQKLLADMEFVHPVQLVEGRFEPEVSREGGNGRSMRFMAAAATDRGNFRNINQDSLLLCHGWVEGRESLLAAVCDGMGGLAKGELASAAVVSPATNSRQSIRDKSFFIFVPPIRIGLLRL